LPDVTVPDIRAFLSDAGVRPTHQRIAIDILLWARPGTQHVEAAMLHANIAASGACISLATIYNALREFERYFGLILLKNSS
jgi:Fur family iron response transcriptional regulator